MRKARSFCLQHLFAQPSLVWLSSLGKKPQIRGLNHLIPPFFQGLNFLIPLLDRIRYVQSLKEIVINVPEQSAVTLGKEQLLCPAPSAASGVNVGQCKRSGNVPGSCTQPCPWGPGLGHTPGSLSRRTAGGPVSSLGTVAVPSCWVAPGQESIFQMFSCVEPQKISVFL